jgi:hypothetical protein
VFGNPSGRGSLNEKFLRDTREGQHWIVNDDLRDRKIRLVPMDQQCRDRNIGCCFGRLFVRHKRESLRVSLTQARETEDLCLVVAMDRTADDLMDLSHCDRGGKLRSAHRAATFFFVFDAEEDTDLGFLTETDVRFPDVVLAEAGFVEADFPDVDLEGGDFFDPDLVEAVADLGDSGLTLSGGSARRR